MPIGQPFRPLAADGHVQIDLQVAAASAATLIRHSPDSVVVDGSNVCNKHLHIFLWLNFRLIPHEPMLLIAGDDIDDNAIGLTNGSLHHRKTLKLEWQLATAYSVCSPDSTQHGVMRIFYNCSRSLTAVIAFNVARLQLKELYHGNNKAWEAALLKGKPVHTHNRNFCCCAQDALQHHLTVTSKQDIA